ncbi:hypothetical protein ACQPXM_05830 [Kribbella sp. CA-253562]|uniref:hypothetical protein n=1 Tax=Kribbella sp. CA-253562 TaxID=3239942 RepID=UPI003D94DA4B
MNDTSRPAGIGRRRLIRTVAAGGAAVAATSLVPSVARAGSPVHPAGALDVRYASSDVVRLLVRYFEDKSSADVDATMSHFSRAKLTYIDAVLGWPSYSWAEQRARFAQFMPSWPASGRSYPTRIQGDAGGAVVHFTNTPELFGQEIRAIAVVGIERGKIVRWIDYWEGRQFPLADIAALRLPADQFPPDFRESTVISRAAPALRRTAESLVAALAVGKPADAAKVFAEDAVLDDLALHATVVGRRSIEAFLTRSLDVLPYGRRSAIRHVTGSAQGGGFEWTSTSPVPRGVTSLELDRSGRIARLTSTWDSSLLDHAALAALHGHTIRN